MQDPPTRATLAKVYEQLANDIKGDDFEAAQKQVKITILKVWPTRKGASGFTDWVNGFQLPLQAEFKRIEFTDVETYKDALRKVSEGLK